MNAKPAVANVPTAAANFDIAGMAAYGASTAALASLDARVGFQVAPAGVRVNTVPPATTRTAGGQMTGEALDRSSRSRPLAALHLPTRSRSRSCTS